MLFFLLSLWLTIKTLFWALFGLGDDTYTLLLPDVDLKERVATEFFGFILYGSYQLIAIILLLNMLVASMTQSYEKILVKSLVVLSLSYFSLYGAYI